MSRTLGCLSSWIRSLSSSLAAARFKLRYPSSIVRKLAVVAIIVSLLHSPTLAAICLDIRKLDPFLGQYTASDVQRFQQLLNAAEGDSGICTSRGTDVCPKRGYYVVWANNAASYWFGPTDGEQSRTNAYLDRLKSFKRQLESIFPEPADYSNVTVHPAIVRQGECVPLGIDRGGVVSTRLLADLGGQVIEIDRIDRDLVQIEAELREFERRLGRGQRPTASDMERLGRARHSVRATSRRFSAASIRIGPSWNCASTRKDRRRLNGTRRGRRQRTRSSRSV